MITKKQLEDMVKTPPVGCEIYQVGNPNSENDIDLVVIYGDCPLKGKIDKEIEVRDYIKKVFGENVHTFKEIKFNQFNRGLAVHVLPYEDFIRDDTSSLPFLVRAYFSGYNCLHGDDHGKEYRKIATEKIRNEPVRTKHYLNRTITHLINAYTEPDSPKDVMNMAINANKFTVNTIKNLSEIYPHIVIHHKDELNQISESIKKTIKEIRGKQLTPEDINYQISIQKALSYSLLSKLEEFSKRFREN